MNVVMVTSSGNFDFDYEKQLKAALDEITFFIRNDLMLLFDGLCNNQKLKNIVYSWAVDHDSTFLVFDGDYDKSDLDLLLVITDDKNVFYIPEKLELYCLTNNINIHPIEIFQIKEIEPPPVPNPIIHETSPDIPPEVTQNIIQAEIEEAQKWSINTDMILEMERQMQEQVNNLFNRQIEQYQRDYHRQVIPGKR